MRAWWLLFLAACNWVYGLDQTQLPDAPGPDAAPRCSASGTLAFSPRVTQAVIQECREYTIRGDLAIAECGIFSRATLAEGPIDAPLVKSEILATRMDAQLVAPRLTPDGDLIVHQEVLPGRNSVASVYRREGGAWTWETDLPFVLAPFERVGMPSKGPRRHLLVKYQDHIEEAVDDGTGTWRTTSSPFSAFGVTTVNSAIHLSADGLRAVFAGTATALPEVRYAVRPRIDAPFEGSFLLSVPAALDAYLTEDCSRLYFSGLGSIFYVPQQ